MAVSCKRFFCLVFLVYTVEAWLPASSLTRPRATQLSMAAVPVIADWKVVSNGKITGIVTGHPSISDGDTITTSPLKDPNGARDRSVVVTKSGSKYRLGIGLETKNGKVAKPKVVKPKAAAPKVKPPVVVKRAAVKQSKPPVVAERAAAKKSKQQQIEAERAAAKKLKQEQQQADAERAAAEKLKQQQQIEAERAAAKKLKQEQQQADAERAADEKLKQQQQAEAERAAAAKLKQQQQIEAKRETIKKYNLNGLTIGDYALSGSPMKSTSGKSNIWTGYRTDSDGRPKGEPFAIKVSNNLERIEREYENYRKVASGVFSGRFVKMIEILPQAGGGQFANQAALVVEKGGVNLKDYFKGKRGGLEGRALRDAAAAAAECIQAVHSSRLVWTDLKSENFVVINDKSDKGGGIEIKGIDLESVCPVKDNPIDYSPESCPPEFIQDLLIGKALDFVLEYSYDIWSYGIMLYELATGRSPYGNNKSASQISRIISSPDYSVDLSDVPDPKLQDLISQCLEVDPKRRPGITQILLHPYFLTTGIGPFSF